jgi:hypothetical protein
VGARVAWRRLSAAAIAAGADGERIAALAESVFAYIDELSAESAEGFAREQAASAGELQRRRERLVALMLSDPPAEAGTVAQAAEEAGWALPTSVAVVALGEGDEAAAVARRIGPTAVGVAFEGREVVVLADPEGPGARAALERAVASGAALGPAVPPAQARRSWERAVAALELVGRDGRLVVAEEHLAELLLGRDRQLSGELAERALAPLDALPAGRRARLAETLAAWLDNDRQPTPTAAALHLHPQTVRYRVRQLRELYGDELDDPERRFELTLALRVREDAGP